MANIQVANTTTNVNKVRRTRYEKMEVAFGKILAADYTVGDVLIFGKIPAREIIEAKFYSKNNVSVVIETKAFFGADFTAITHALADTGAKSDISYVISYIRGTGKIDDGAVQAGEGRLVKVTVTS